MYFKGIDLTYLNDCEIYNLVLERKIPTFPSGYWCHVSKERGREIAVTLLRYLIDTRLKLDRAGIVNSLSKEFILENKLWTPCKLYFGKSAIKYLMAAYPDQYKAFQFIKCRIPQGYWNQRQNRINAIMWLIEEKLNWDIECIKNNFCRGILTQNGFATLTVYYTSSFEAISEAYPGLVYPWELKKSSVPTGYWSHKKNRIEAVKWLVKEKLSYCHEEVVSRLCVNDFVRYRLGTLIYYYYNESIVEAVIEAYGDKFMRWEFGYHRWTEETARDAVIWLVDKLHTEQGKNPKEISYYDFQRYKLRTIVDKYYKSSPRKAIEDALR